MDGFDFVCLGAWMAKFVCSKCFCFRRRTKKTHKKSSCFGVKNNSNTRVDAQNKQ